MTLHVSLAHWYRLAHIRIGLCLSIACLLALHGSRVFAQKTVSIPEEIEWTWEVQPPHSDAHLPNVLLLGDSITRNYFPTVVKALQGTANVYLMAVSTSIGDPRLQRQIAEFSTMQNVSFQVVHFNNGMHGWAYTEAQYKAAFPIFLQSVQALAAKRGSLIWASITPVAPNAFNGATNPRIDERNHIALDCIRTKGISLDEQHSLMMKHLDTYEDKVHFNPAGAAIMGVQAAESIRAVLNR